MNRLVGTAFVFALISLSAPALTDPALSLIWSSTTGSGTPGSNTIEAAKGDILELDIVVSDLDGQGLLAVSGIYLNWDSTDLTGLSLGVCPNPPYATAGQCYDPLTLNSLAQINDPAIPAILPLQAGPYSVLASSISAPAFYGWTNPMTLGRLTVEVDGNGAFYSPITSEYNGTLFNGILTGAIKWYEPEAEAVIIPPGCG